MMEKESDLIELDKVKFIKNQCAKRQLLEETENVMLYSNLYPIKFTKEINIYEYSFNIFPEVHEENVILKIFRDASKEIFKTYWYYYRSGPTFFALKEVNQTKEFKVSVYNKGKNEYTLTVNNHGHHSKIEKGQTHDFSEIDEKCIFLILGKYYKQIQMSILIEITYIWKMKKRKYLEIIIISILFMMDIK